MTTNREEEVGPHGFTAKQATSICELKAALKACGDTGAFDVLPDYVEGAAPDHINRFIDGVDAAVDAVSGA